MEVTRIETCVKNKKRVNVFLDGEFAFSCYASTIIDDGICVGVSLEADDIERIRRADGLKFAWCKALRYLQSGLRTEYQVRQKLAECGTDDDHIDVTITRLREYGYVNDREFAELYADRLYEKYGKWIVATKLRQKGISDSLITEFASRDGDQDVLRHHVARLFQQHRRVDADRREARIMRALAAKGFEFGDIRRAIREIESQEEHEE